MSGEANQALELAVYEHGWRCRSCGWVSVDIEGQAARNEGLLHFAEKHPRALIAEVERLTQERDQARDIAVALEQQTAEALRIALLPLDGYDLSENFDQMPWAMRALRKVVRLLETENQQ